MQRQQYCRAAGSMWHGMWWCDPERAQARHGAMEPTSAPLRMAASLDCVRSCTPLSFVSRCRGSTRTFRLSKRAFVVMPRIDRPVVWGRAASAGPRLSLAGDVCGLPGRSRYLHRVQSGGAAARIYRYRVASAVHRIARSQGHPALGADKILTHPAPRPPNPKRTREQAVARRCGKHTRAQRAQCGSRGRGGGEREDL